MIAPPSDSACPYDDREQRVADLLAGRLSEAQADELWKHSFGCDACFAQLELSAGLNAAVREERAPSTAAPDRSRIRTAPGWAWAAAAMLAVALLGVVLWRPAGEVGPVLRGEHRALGVRIAADPSGLRISWPAVPEAETYAVQVFTEDGELLWEEVTSRAAAVAPAAALAPVAGARPLRVQVEALDRAGRTILRSDLVPAGPP